MTEVSKGCKSLGSGSERYPSGVQMRSSVSRRIAERLGAVPLAWRLPALPHASIIE